MERLDEYRVVQDNEPEAEDERMHQAILNRKNNIKILTLQTTKQCILQRSIPGKCQKDEG